MKERPIIFNAPMVRAIQNDTKTQIRRPINPQPPNDAHLIPGGLFGGKQAFVVIAKAGRYISPRLTQQSSLVVCPYGQPGDRLWVRETWQKWDDKWCDCLDKPCGCPNDGDPFYRADCDYAACETLWRPPIHMPRWASRITLEITKVRVERAQDITEQDVIAEGVSHEDVPLTGIFADNWRLHNPEKIDSECPWASTTSVKMCYQMLWDSIYGKIPGVGWNSNPWVWVVGFRRFLS